MLSFNFIPQQNDDPIKDIEPITDISEHPIRQQLEQHLESEDDAENEITDLHSPGQQLRLVVEFDAHAEGVDQDAEKDELLEEVVVHELLNV